MKCLVIDDEDFNREFVATLLEGVAECEGAANGSEAVAGFNAALEAGAPYDLVLLDIMMPGMNGHDTAKAIRSIEKKHGLDAGKRTKIIMLTSLNSPRDAMESFCSAQSSAYIVKPVSREKLTGVISKLGLPKKQTCANS